MGSSVSTTLRAVALAVGRRYADPRGWWVTAALTALAAAIRLPNLSWPHAFSFDETYYAKDAFSLLTYGYERAFVGPANDLLLKGNTAVFRDTAEFVVHPSLGKWAIALGESLFGMNPFGWRIVMAILGIAAVGLLHRTALRLTANVHIAALAALFMAIDGQAIVLSRTALLDQTLMFFVLVTFWALLRDRDAYEHTLAMREYLDRVPRLRLLRPWRLLAIIAITCAFSTKWSALWFAIAFALLALWWDGRARRRHDVDASTWLADIGWLVAAAVIGTAGYLLSWIGWFRSTDAWDRTYADGSLTWLPQPLRGLIYYHQQALHFHVTLTSDHPYKANPFGWLLQIRPTSFFYESYQPGQGPCRASTVECASEVLALGNIVVWWTATLTIALLALNLLARLLRIRIAPLLHFNSRVQSRVPWDAVAGPLVGVAAGWLPWLYYHERTTFTFYTIVFTPFVCLLAAQGLALFATQRVRVHIPVPEQSRTEFDAAMGAAERALFSDDTDAELALVGVMSADAEYVEPSLQAPLSTYVELDVVHPRRLTIAVGVVVIAIVFSVFAMPLWTGSLIPYSGWQMRMLLQSWI